MLQGSLTKNNTGILIRGDYYDLEQLHKFLWAISDDYAEGEFENTLFMGLAYDIRKAMEGNRNIIDVTPDVFMPTPLKYFSTEYVLPYFLATLSTIRQCMAYRLNNHAEQSIAFALESLTLQALLSKSKKHGQAIFDWTQNYYFRQEEFAQQLLTMSTLDFLKFSKSEKINLLTQTFTKHFIDEREISVNFLKKEAKKSGKNPHDISFAWPDITW